MLHFHNLNDWNLDETPFGVALRHDRVPHRFVQRPVTLRYRTVWERLFRVYPRLFLASLSMAWESLRSTPTPVALQVTTDVQAFVAGLLRRVLRKPTRVVFVTFIVQQPRSPLKKALVLAYWRMILGLVDAAIVHSTSELREYAALFPSQSGKFAFIPYGIDVNPPAPALVAAARSDRPLIVSAGRSGRDYKTLAKAVAGLDCSLRIICNTPDAVADVPASPQIRVLDDCFGWDYLAQLAAADIVVVPLSAQDVSAGQMVFLQAASFGKPIVTTATAGIWNYVVTDENGLTVPMHDAAAMRAAILRLLDDPALAARLGAAAQARFAAEHSTETYVRRIAAAMQGRSATAVTRPAVPASPRPSPP